MDYQANMGYLRLVNEMLKMWYLFLSHLQNVTLAQHLKHLIQLFPIYIPSPDICSVLPGSPGYSWLELCWLQHLPLPPPMCPQYRPPCKFLLIIHKFHAMYTSLLTLHPAIPLLCLCYTCYTFLTPSLTAFLFYQETLPAMCLQNSWRCKFLLMTHNSYTSWRIRPYLAPCN